jgi:hypothetical protein
MPYGMAAKFIAGAFATVVNFVSDRINGSGDIVSEEAEKLAIKEAEQEKAKPVVPPKPYVPASGGGGSSGSGVKVSIPKPSPKPAPPKPPPTIEVQQGLVGAPVKVVTTLGTIWKFVTTAYAGWVAFNAVREVVEGLQVKPIATTEPDGFKFGKLTAHNYSPTEQTQIEWGEIVGGDEIQKHHQESFEGFALWLANQTGKIDNQTYDTNNKGDFYDQGALVWPMDTRDFSGGVFLMFGSKTVGDVFANYWTRSLNAERASLRGVTWADVKPQPLKPSWERNYSEKKEESGAGATAEGELAESISNLIAAGAVMNPTKPGQKRNVKPTVKLENTNINKTGTKGGLPMCQWPLDRNTVIGTQTAQSAVLDVVTNTQLVNVNAKLGPQVAGGITGWLGRFAKSLYLDKALNFINVLLNVHNAMMLSRNLVMTLGEVQNLVINAIGKQMKNETLQQFDVNKEVGKAFKGLIESILGKEQSDDLTKRIARYNRILSAATNLLNNVESILFSLSEMMSLAGEYQGKVGNALKRSGVILEDSYEAMQEKWRMMTNQRFAKIDKVLRGIDKSTEVADNLAGIAGEAVEIPEHLEELQKSRKELTKAVKEAEPERSPGNKKIQEKAEKEKKDSASPNIAETDKLKPETDQ